MEAEWKFSSGDLGAYIFCSKCGRKIGARKVLFADLNILHCPKCKSEMQLSEKILDDCRSYASVEDSTHL